MRKINSQSEITFLSKKFTRKFLNDINLKIDLAYGRMNFSKKSSVANNILNCNGNINFLEEFPLLFFNCNITIDDKKEFLKIFSIKSKKKNETLKLNFNGNLNVINNNIKFKNVLINDNNNISKEDLIYFENIFKEIMLDRSFLEMFSFKKFKKFIFEIS